MKRDYMKPDTKVLGIIVDKCILQTSSIPIIDEENNGDYDVKEESLTDEDLYRNFLGWD